MRHRVIFLRHKFCRVDPRTVEIKNSLRILFAGVFAEINEMIIRGVIEKSVPVATQRGRIVGGAGECLLGNMKSLGAPFYSYGWNLAGKGFCGGTPELLVDLDGCR